MVYPKEGDLLDIRLFDDGHFEYDAYPPQEPPQNLRGKIQITRKESRLSPESLQELLSITEQSDFLNAKDSYPRLQPHVDDNWKTTINYKYMGHQKKIVLIDFWDIRSHPEDRSKYPASLVKFMERIYKLEADAVQQKGE